jgi:hypothetical protein
MICMNASEEHEAQFKTEIKRFCLHFKDPDLEQKYTYYKIYEKPIPSWFKWLMWSLIIIIFLRKLELLIFVFAGIQANTVALTVEITLISVMVAAALIELIIFLCIRLTVVKGFALLVAAFFLISYNSYTLFPTNLGLIPLYNP